MSVPVPAYPLENVCATIFNNTLYTYSSTAFQSLELTTGAKWKTLEMGVKVAGSVCVKTTPVSNNDASALWIVGGKAANDTDYMGLQKYEFLTQQWETIRTLDPVARDRLWHGAAYLNKSDSILMYAGTQDGTRQASSQTFTIKASAPYDVTAYEAAAPPAIAPVVLPWTQSKAVYIGGSETNTKVMLFSPTKSWIDSNATLASPFYNCSRILAVSQNGNDMSKSIYTFDMTVRPNTVNRTVIIDGEGNPVQNAVPIGAVSHTTEDDSSLDGLERRDDLTISNWPAYNDTLAPDSVRSNYAVARDQNGLTVITGGNTDDVLCMFKARDNCWLNSSQIFSAQSVTTEELAPGASSSSPSTFIASVPNSSASPAAESSPGTPFPVKILGAVLGSVLGVALVLIGILFFLRWKRKQRAFNDMGHQRRASGLSDDKMDFADRGLPHMSSTRQYRHEPMQSVGSFSSMALLLGRTKGHKRGTEKGNGSQGSNTSSQFNKDYKAAIGKPTPIQNTDQAFRAFAMPTTTDEKQPVIQERVSPRPRPATKASRLASTRRSSGWNRYWSGGSALNILGFGKRSTIADDERSDRSSSSRYSAPRLPSQLLHTTAMVPPLKYGDRPAVQRVNSGSPTIHDNGQFNFMRASTAQIQRPGSVSTLSSFDGKRDDAFSSGVPESVYDEFSSNNVFSDSNYLMKDPQAARLPQSSQPPSSRGQSSTDMSWLNLGDQRRL